MANITKARYVITSILLFAIAIGLLTPQCRDELSLVSRYWSRTRPITLHGRVVDQRGNPIAGAAITIAVSSFNAGGLVGSRNYLQDECRSYTSDQDGKFTVDRLSGTYLRVERIICDGYEKFPEPHFNRFDLIGFRSSQDRGVPYYVPDPQKPAVFPLCKQGETRVVWPSRGGADEPNPW